MAVSKKAQKVISRKIREVAKKGIRGKKVSRAQAIAVGLATARRRGFKIPKKK